MKYASIVLISTSMLMWNGSATAFFLSKAEKEAQIVNLSKISDEAQLTFTYDYVVENADAEKLFTRANEYFSLSFNDFKEVNRTSSLTTRTIIGKALIPWSFSVLECYTQYDIKFATKDSKARLQLTLKKTPAIVSNCGAYDLPSNEGYEKILTDFTYLSSGLEDALSADSSWKDF